jgi:hypothetical protein
LSRIIVVKDALHASSHTSSTSSLSSLPASTWLPRSHEALLHIAIPTTPAFLRAFQAINTMSSFCKHLRNRPFVRMPVQAAIIVKHMQMWWVG